MIHTTFTIRRRELESIATALKEQKKQAVSGEFVSIKFNDRSRFFGFATDHNSRVPYESTVISLSRNEFLVWFEGLQYNRPTVREMVGGPLHVQFTYPNEGMNSDQQRAHLQDAINLSGANWRGFNAKSLPVSVYYAQLIAKYLKEFESHRLPPVDVSILTPWSSLMATTVFKRNEIILLLGAGASVEADIPDSNEMVKEIEKLVSSDDLQLDPF